MLKLTRAGQKARRSVLYKQKPYTKKRERRQFEKFNYDNWVMPPPEQSAFSLGHSHSQPTSNSFVTQPLQGPFVLGQQRGNPAQIGTRRALAAQNSNVKRVKPNNVAAQDAMSNTSRASGAASQRENSENSDLSVEPTHPLAPEGGGPD